MLAQSGKATKSGDALDDDWPKSKYTKFPNSMKELQKILAPSEFGFLSWLLFQTVGWHREVTDPVPFRESAEAMNVSHNTAQQAAAILVGLGVAQRYGQQGKTPKFTLNYRFLEEPCNTPELLQNLEKLRSRSTCAASAQRRGVVASAVNCEQMRAGSCTPKNGEVLDQNLENTYPITGEALRQILESPYKEVKTSSSRKNKKSFLKKETARAGASRETNKPVSEIEGDAFYCSSFSDDDDEKQPARQCLTDPIVEFRQRLQERAWKHGPIDPEGIVTTVREVLKNNPSTIARFLQYESALTAPDDSRDANV